VAWVADVPGGKAKYVAVFHTGDTGKEEIRINWADLGLSGKCTVRDLWEKKDLETVAEGRTFTVDPHAGAIFKITPK
jgi:hypothetical protein